VMGLIKSGMIEYGIAGGADTAQSKPGDALEYTASAGGAFFILGTKKIVAKINETISYITDTPDFWRKAYQKYPVHGGSFTGEPAYYKHVIAATEKLMEKVGTKPDDYNHVVFHQPNGKFPRRAAKKLGFNEEQLKYGLLVGEIGNTYSGASILGLANVLDNAKPGERILLTSYGSGAGSDSFDIVVTDEILNMQKNIMKGKKLQNMIDDKKYVNYTEYRRLIE
ncbi:hydroxymethylglutaryl-CoA synthase, partial [archaeon]|nr:hydroxymethylglutaryl-CoA synthase [archaeon]